MARKGKPAVSQALFSANDSGRTLFERNSTLEYKKNTLRSFSLSEGEEKSAHSVPRTPQLLLRISPTSFPTAQPIQSITPILCHLYPDWLASKKKKHTTRLVFLHTSVFLYLCLHIPELYTNVTAHIVPTQRRDGAREWISPDSVRWNTNQTLIKWTINKKRTSDYWTSYRR